MIPGEIQVADGDIELNKGRPTVSVSVANHGDRPVQVGSHYHFAETYDAEGHIHFDFRLQPGRCQTTNAKYLLRLAGILDE